jgi:hypothetical protein
VCKTHFRKADHIFLPHPISALRIRSDQISEAYHLNGSTPKRSAVPKSSSGPLLTAHCKVVFEQLVVIIAQAAALHLGWAFQRAHVQRRVWAGMYSPSLARAVSSSSELVTRGLELRAGFGTPARAPSSSESDNVVDDDEDPEDLEVLDAEWGAPSRNANAGRTLASKAWKTVSMHMNAQDGNSQP